MLIKRAASKMIRNILKHFQKKGEETGLKPALFLHIQKTAGTSVISIARMAYGEKNVVSHSEHDMKGFKKLQDTRFVSGHFGFDFARPLMEFRYSFTFLRDPVERVLSLYFFCRRSNPNEYAIYRLAREKTLDEFLDMALDHTLVRAHIWNHQTWQLACGWYNITGKKAQNYDEEAMINDAKMHLAEFDYVGFTESFDHDIQVILNHLGISRLEKILKTNVGAPRPRIAELPPTTRVRLRQITEMDQILYDYAMSKRMGKG